MIRAEIRFKNSAFIKALERVGYKSVAAFSRESGICYTTLIEYANLRYMFNKKDQMQKMIDLLESDEWTLFEQYREVVEKSGKDNKRIIAEIPVSKILSLSSKKGLYLESDEGVESLANKNGLKEALNKALSTLKDREKDVIEMYFGLNGKKQMDLQEISEEYSISRERIRQIKEKSIRRLKHKSRSERFGLADYLGNEKEI